MGRKPCAGAGAGAARWLLSCLVALSLALDGCSLVGGTPAPVEAPASDVVALADVPEYAGAPYVEVDGNVPAFPEEELSAAYGTEEYGELDALGRCTTTFAVVGPETAPTEPRGSIGSVFPTGWHLVRYGVVDGGYLYNRCHLIGYQLTAENANERNLITGTRYLNVVGMLPFEDEVDDYVEETGGHVLYKSEPVFEGDNLLASGRCNP